MAMVCMVNRTAVDILNGETPILLKNQSFLLKTKSTKNFDECDGENYAVLQAKIATRKAEKAKQYVCFFF